MKKTIILVMFMALIRLTHADIITGTNQAPVPTWNTVKTNLFVVTPPSGTCTLKVYVYKPGDTILIVSDSIPVTSIGKKTNLTKSLLPNTLYHYKSVVTQDTALQVIDGLNFTTLPLPTQARIDSIREISNQGISTVTIHGFVTGYNAGFYILYYSPTGTEMKTDTIFGTGNFHLTLQLQTPTIGSYEYYVIEHNDSTVNYFLRDTLIGHDSLTVTVRPLTAAPAISISDTVVTCGFFTGDFHLNPAAGDTARMVVTYGTDGINFPDTAFVEDDLDRIITLFERKVPMIANQYYWIKITGISKDGVRDSIIIRTHSRSGQAPTLLRLVEGINTTQPIIIVLGDAGCDYATVSVTFTKDGGSVEFTDTIIVGPLSYQDTLLLPTTMPDGSYTVLTCATNSVDYVCKIMTIQKGIATGLIDHLSQSDIDPETLVSIYGSDGKLIAHTMWRNVNEFIPYNNPCTIKDSNGVLLKRIGKI